MFRNFLALSILLTLIFTCGSANETIIATHIYDDEPLNQIQHKVELLSNANENLRLRIEVLKDHLDKQSEDLKEIKERLSGNDKTSVTSTGFDNALKNLESRMENNDERLVYLTKVLEELKAERTATASSFDTALKNLDSRMVANDERLRNLTKDLIEQKEALSAKEGSTVSSTSFDTAMKRLDSRMVANDERLGDLTMVLIALKEELSAKEKTSTTFTDLDAAINHFDSRMETNDERLDNLTKVLIEVKESLSAKEGRANITAYASSCLELSEGVQSIRIDGFSQRPFNVLCDNSTHGGGWTVIQSRVNGSVDFYRNLADYKCGFGDLGGEFFIGLEKLHALTNASVNELLIVMRDNENIERFAKYDAFAIGDEHEGYALNILGKFSGDAGDSLHANRLQKFYTKDNDSSIACAEQYSGAWWYASNCGYSNLNGKYGDSRSGHGVNWEAFRGFQHSLPYVKMLIRPRSPCSL